jgi:hypothetical protein
LQTALQQSLPDWHVSLACWQNDPAWQVPFELQNAEQHWEPWVQASPTPWQLPVSAAHVPGDPPSELHRPPQHCTFAAQVWPT